jgi:hypothetical protein
MTTIARVVDGKIETVTHEPRSSTLCWHCCHAFDAEPVPFPYKWDERRNVFTVCGAFCSFACVCGYNRDRGRLHNGKNCGMQIFQLYKQVTGMQKPPPCAPPRNLLQAFGGHMTIDEFRAISETVRYVELPSNCTVHKSVYLETPRSEGSKSIRSGTNAFVNAITRASEIRVPRDGVGGVGGADGMGGFGGERHPKRKKTMLELALGM